MIQERRYISRAWRPQTPRPRAAGCSTCGTSMLVGAHSWSISSMLRGRPGPPCSFTSEGNRFGELGDLPVATPNVDWLLRVVASGPCFLSWGPTRQQEGEEVSHFYLGPLYTAQEFLQYPPLSTPSMEWKGRETDTGLSKAQTSLPTCIQLLLPAESSLTEPRSTVWERTPLLCIPGDENRVQRHPTVRK